MDIKTIKLLRNKTIYSNLEAAKEGISSYVKSKGDLDGVVILGRYTSGETVTSIMAAVYGSGNTATITYTDSASIDQSIEQLAQDIETTKIELIGKDGDTGSADTIKGAKAYTDAKINVLDLNDEKVNGSFVTAVKQENGQISVERAELKSTDKTITVTPIEDGSVDFVANIDNDTIVKDGTTGKISVDSAALVQYIGSDAVKVSNTVNKEKTISLAINANDKILSQSDNGLLSTVGISYDEDKRLIKLTGKDNAELGTIDATKFIKDGMLYGEETFIATATTQSVTIKGQTHSFSNLTVGSHYIVLLFATYDGTTKKTEYSWDILDTTDIIDVYKAGDGLQLSADGHTFSVKADADAESFLSVSSNGVKISGVQSAIDSAVSKAKTELIGDAAAEYDTLGKLEDRIQEVDKKAASAHTNVNAKANGHVTVTVTTKQKTDGTSYSDVTVAENDIASATGLTGEISRAKGAEDTIETSVGLAADGKHIATSGNYTKNATTVVGEISALDTQAKTNADNISANAAKITANANNISANAASIKTNANNIAALDTQVKANTASIKTNADNISANAAKIKTNADNISANASNISALNTNVSNISSNIKSLSAATVSVTASTETESAKYLEVSSTKDATTKATTYTVKAKGIDSAIKVETDRAKAAESAIDTYVGKSDIPAGKTVMGVIVDNEKTTAEGINAVAKAAGVINANDKITYTAPTKSGSFSATTSIMDMLNQIDGLWNTIDGGTF